MNSAEFKQEFTRLGHAIQTGVKMKISRGPDREGEASPKHLRVGVNLAMCEHAALVELLVKRGIINEAEYYDSVLSKLRQEVASYEAELSTDTTKVTLL